MLPFSFSSNWAWAAFYRVHPDGFGGTETFLRFETFTRNAALDAVQDVSRFNRCVRGPCERNPGLEERPERIYPFRTFRRRNACGARAFRNEMNMG